LRHPYALRVESVNGLPHPPQRTTTFSAA
jgi:hypothetical protein